MKISNIFNSTNIYKNHTKKDEAVTKLKKTNDNLEVSDKAKDFQNVLKAISKAPDIRENKIDNILKQMEDKTYNVSTDDIVEKLIKKL